MIQDERSPFFTTSHFDGHLSVLIRGSRIGELTLQELSPRRVQFRTCSRPPQVLGRLVGK